jgi:hypothetical protein
MATPRGGAIVKTSAGAQALARALAGELPPNKCQFHCVTCGFVDPSTGKAKRQYLTLEFDEDEIEALGGDVRSYSGSCPDCDHDTLVPFDMMMGSDFNIRGAAQANRRQEYEEQAQVFIDKAKEAVVGVMGGSSLDQTPEERTGADDLPDAADVDVSGMTGRSGG